jgi:uncharacterized membrane protein YjjP (DUF1212 family)
MTVHDRTAFVLRMAEALHRYGHPAHRLEEALAATSHKLGLEAQFFSTPTSIFASFGPVEGQHTHLIRMDPGGADLGRLAKVDRIALRVIRGELTPAEGAGALDVLDSESSPYGRTVTLIAFAIASAGAARFFGGGLPEVLAAGLAGISTGVLAFLVGSREHLVRLFEPGAAFIATVLITLLSLMWTPISVSVAVMGGLIILVPGLALTVAMTELASQHLVSGTARLSQAMLIFLTIIFGVAAGGRLVTLVIGGTHEAVIPVGLPGWTEWAALALAPISFAVLFQVERRDIPWVMVTGWLAYGSSTLGNAWFDPELAAFIGALTVGVASNLYALVLDRPAQVTLVPGVLLLVPGSLGFRSVSSLLEREVITGVETAFQMALIATALVAGLLVANVAVPRRKSE